MSIGVKVSDEIHSYSLPECMTDIHEKYSELVSDYNVFAMFSEIFCSYLEILAVSVKKLEVHAHLNVQLIDPNLHVIDENPESPFQ